MERRLLLAVVLMTAAILITNVLFPPPPQPEEAAELPTADSVVVPPPAPAVAALPTGAPQLPADTVTIDSPLYRYEISSRGGTVVGAELKRFASYSTEGQVQLVSPTSSGLFINRLVTSGDTLDLRTLSFTVDDTAVTVADSARTVNFAYGDPAGFSISLSYRFEPDSYLVGVTGRVTGVDTRNTHLLTNLGPGLGVHEHPDHHSEQQFAAVSRSRSRVSRSMFRRIDEDFELGDSLSWAGIKDKYFLAVAIAGEGAPLLSGARVMDVPDVTMQREEGEKPVVLPQAVVSIAVPVAADGTFSFGAYMGPQEYAGLSAIGSDLQEVTPYGYRWLEPIIRPLAAAVMWILTRLHNSLGIAYGWVLILFGVGMRIVTWPLNARAMRAQMKNMAVQPLMAEIKEKYADDPKKQQEAIFALYKEHGFNPLGGCLPMLIPFPVLVTLFFVFQNTIAFRGASFLWLSDLSLRDPLNILPVILMGSMFGLQWVSSHLSGMEQNQQAKMMMYTMPLVMGFMFFFMPSGLNVYYASTQLASMPQQVMIARERKAAQEALKANAVSKPTPRGAGGTRKAAPNSRRKS